MTRVVIGVAAGIGLAFVDSLPHWDDAGVLVGAMLLVSCGLTLVGGRPPWLLALATGMWIPARTIIAGGDPLTAVVLIIPFLGAYAGAFIRGGEAGRIDLNQPGPHNFGGSDAERRSRRPPRESAPTDNDDHGEQAETE
jgi:hypothetical protein